MISKYFWYIPRRGFALACPPRYPPGMCACPAPYMPRIPARPIPRADCQPPGPVPYNPCRPIFYTGHGFKKYKYIFYMFLLPLIVIRTIVTLSHDAPHKPESCREYEYMRKRTKRYPWGDGTKTFFHNDHTNNLPVECAPPEKDESDFDEF